ncbi:MAG: hypothetical protein HY321_12035 [Armatimonadetes bacterium]|nr:hypothetical protein [Armatimonadota bacterium]
MPRSLVATVCLLLLSLGGASAADTPPPDPGVTADGVLELRPVETPPAPVPLPALPAPPATLLPVRPDGGLVQPLPPPRAVLHTVKAYYVGYAPDSFEAVRRYVSAVDIVAGQWLAVSAGGQLTEARDHARNDEVRRIVRQAGRRVYTCVVNAGFDRAVLSAVLNNRERRTAVADRIVAFVERKGDDGVDLDFEGVRPGHQDGYTAFVRELAEKLHARGKELCLAVDASWDGSPSPGYDYRALSQYADSIMPMTYTFGPGSVPIAPIDYLEKAAAKGTTLMEPRKFMIGMGVYGRSCDLRTGRRTTPNSAIIRSLLERYAPEVVFDPETLTKRFRYQDEGGREHIVFFDDPETIGGKLARLADRHQVGAVGFWRMGQEDPSLWELIQVASARRRPTTAGLGARTGAWRAWPLLNWAGLMSAPPGEVAL